MIASGAWTAADSVASRITWGSSFGSDSPDDNAPVHVDATGMSTFEIEYTAASGGVTVEFTIYVGSSGAYYHYYNFAALSGAGTLAISLNAPTVSSTF